MTEETVLANLQQICGMLGVIHRNRWIKWSSRRGSRQPLARAPASPFVRSREPWRKSTLDAPEFDKDAFAAWNALVSSDRARLLPRASLVREAKRLLEAQSIEAGRCPLCGQKVDQKCWREGSRARSSR